jgi:hypothetical protein
MKFPQIGIVAKPVRHQISATGALERCLTKAGYRVRASYDRVANEKIVFCWGWGKAKEIREVNPEAIICCLDHGYNWTRKQHVNTGWSTPELQFGLNGFGEHPVVDDGGARSREKGWWDELAPVRESVTKDALLFGQVYGDAMIVDHVEDYGLWLKKISGELQEQGWRVFFRPHPIMVFRNQVERYGNLGRLSRHKDLYDDLRSVDYAVAMNSNALVQAYTAGVPRVTAYNKGTMLWPLIREPGRDADTDGALRDKWWGRMAWCQWAYDELENGLWLEHHAPIMHRLYEGDRPVPWHDTRL